MTASWRVEHVALDVSEAHEADLTGRDATRLVRVHEITRPALVLGSTQRASDIDAATAAAAGVDVVRRRSGGGAVLLSPADVLWLDVVVPAGDQLWHPDVAVAFEWLGEVWVHALAAEGIGGTAVHRGALVRTHWSDVVCFAGLGPGEVTRYGAKLVGISQRRTRHAARFQCAVLARWDVVGIATLLGLDTATIAELQPLATGVDIDQERLVTAFVAALPS